MYVCMFVCMSAARSPAPLRSRPHPTPCAPSTHPPQPTPPASPSSCSSPHPEQDPKTIRAFMEVSQRPEALSKYDVETIEVSLRTHVPCGSQPGHGARRGRAVQLLTHHPLGRAAACRSPQRRSCLHTAGCRALPPDQQPTLHGSALQVIRKVQGILMRDATAAPVDGPAKVRMPASCQRYEPIHGSKRVAW